MHASDEIFAYIRTLDGVDALVILNFTATEHTIDLSTDQDSGILGPEKLGTFNLILANYSDRVEGENILTGGKLTLRGWEGLLFVAK